MNTGAGKKIESYTNDIQNTAITIQPLNKNIVRNSLNILTEIQNKRTINNEQLTFAELQNRFLNMY